PGTVRGAGSPDGLPLRRRPPTLLRLRGPRPDPDGDRPRRPRRLPHRRGGRRRPAAGHPAPVGHRHAHRRHERARRARRRSRHPQRLPRDRGPLRHRRRRPAGRRRGAGGRVAEALRGLRRPHQPHAGHRQRELMRTTTVIIGAGHAGLAMSRRLTERSIDHVVLERGEVANSWRRERWPSLRLLTPNWQTRLPGAAYEGDDPDGFATMPEVIRFLQGFADLVAAPVRTQTAVTGLRTEGPGYEVATTQGVWRCDSVVLASGACNRPVIPDVATAVPPSVAMVTPMSYRGPETLD